MLVFPACETGIRATKLLSPGGKDVKMSPLRPYEKIIERALRSISSGPWTATDLAKAREIMDDHFCGLYEPNCTSSAVMAWLDSLDADQQEELLFEANTDWSASQDPWALGSG
jgi:hypothetical protein